MVHIVLVHGLGATEKSWFRIPDALEAAGHTVKAVLLPGSILSGLEDFAAEIVSVLRSDKQSVLIGHSMGGVSISQAAANSPSLVSKLIYVTALVPRNGESAGGIIGALGTSFDNVGNEFDRVDIGRQHPARRLPIFGALMGEFKSSTSFANIPKHYVRCSTDTVVTPPKQAEMIGKWPGTTESTVEAGHIPQKEAPDKLSQSLLKAIG
ncbi:alpha/beta fold hydrolase [uncultured Roseobacter sp.]|uniref:alpha/beta fold hydrolase n=1 Tax=uncultured Roseobacter sp. TaxID=114847 RepID=UPI002626EADE|nr:alpha/beta fold hydrolase [uncultured Roseobacter sp.]